MQSTTDKKEKKAEIEILYDRFHLASINQHLGYKINEYYKKTLEPGESLVVLVILKGSAIFFSDLVRQLNIPLKTEFISISSYGHDTESSGQVRFELDVRDSIKDRHVLIVEDIIDTGNSLSTVLKHLEARSPKSLNIVTLLSKPSRREVEVDVKWIGLEIADKFVVGYGMDYAERYRELPYIGILNFVEL
tara:strand:+ start:1304 stop:1876 length:573 start_codon:yes stop_codon:yes gene_type:complete